MDIVKNQILEAFYHKSQKTIYSEHIAMFWECSGNVLGMFRECSGNVPGMFRAKHHILGGILPEITKHHILGGILPETRKIEIFGIL
jgi:hypothetical protein